MAVSRAGLSQGDFFTNLGMLIIQGRKWDAFRRMRGRGLHCPTVRNSSPPHHQCSLSNVECQTALSFRNAIQAIWQYGGSVVIDVILLPECGHQDTCLLLEKWLIQRTDEKSTMPELSLMQAIDSTIHFSQLCSWWSSTNGSQPRNIQYKVYEHNESQSDLKFVEPAVNHNFMASNGVKVRLQYLPRQKNIPELQCICCRPNFGSQQQMDVGSPNRGRSFTHRGPRRGSRHSSASSDSLSPSVSRVDVSPYGSPLLSPYPRTPISSSSSSRGSSRTVSPCVSRSPSERSIIKAFETHRLMEEPELPPNENSILSRNDSGFMDIASRDGVTINQDEELANQLDSLSDSDLSDDYVIDGPVGSPGLLGTPIASPDDVRVQMLQSTYAGWHCRHPAFDRLMGEAVGTHDRTRHSSLDSAVSNLERLDLRTRRQLSRTNSDGKDFANLKVNCSKDSDKEFFIRDIKKRHKLKSPNLIDNDDAQHCSQNNTFYASFLSNPRTSLENSDPILDFCNSPDDFSSNFTGFEFSQHHLNSTPTTIGFVTMTRPVSLDLPQISSGFTPENSKPFESCRTKRKVRDETSTPTDTSINPPQHDKSNDFHGIDETPTYKSTRPKLQVPLSHTIKSSNEKKCETSSPMPTTSEKFTLQIGKPALNEDDQLENKAEDSVTNTSCSILLRSPPSKLRILPSHCVDKNYLHNPPRQPIHKISTNVVQNGTARRLQFNKPSEKSTCTSPAPIRRNNSIRFEFDEDMPKLNQRSSRSMCRGKCMKKNGIVVHNHTQLTHTDRLLGSFEESIIHNRLEVLGTVEGFHAQLGASGSFCPAKVKLPVPVKFFHVSDDNAPSPYMGTMSVKGRECGKRGYHIPRKGTIQLTLFNPNNSVVKVFVILYDVSNMPPGHRTFLRHRIYSKPTNNFDHNGNVVKCEGTDVPQENSQKGKCLRYFVNAWLESSKTNKVYIHGDVKILFSLASNEWDSGNTYELQSETEFPKNPKYSPK